MLVCVCVCVFVFLSLEMGLLGVSWGVGAH